MEAIKAEGLVLVTDKSAGIAADEGPLAEPSPRLPEGIDGVLKASGVLRFNESIDM